MSYSASEALDLQGDGGAQIKMGEVIKDVLAQMSKGVKITHISLPASLFQPVSVLERLSNIMSRGHFLTKVFEAESPLDRFLAVVKWQIGGLLPEKVWGKKPFNPVLGERHHCWWTLPMPDGDANIVHFLAEQVSHHPAISAFHLHDAKRRFAFDAEVLQDASMSGNSVTIKFQGPQLLQLLQENESYTISIPHMCVRGLLLGERHTEWAGPLLIECKQLGFRADIIYEQRGALRGTWDRISGTISDQSSGVLYRLEGVWTKRVDLIHAKTSERVEFFVQSAEPVLRPIHPPPHLIHDRDSQRVWGEARRRMCTGDYIGATTAKHAVEAAQRLLPKEDQFTASIFRRNADGAWFVPLDSDAVREAEAVVHNTITESAAAAAAAAAAVVSMSSMEVATEVAAGSGEADTDTPQPL